MKIINKKHHKKLIIASVISLLVVSIGILSLDKLGIISIFPKNEPLPHLSDEPTPTEKESEKKTDSAQKEAVLDEKDNAVEQSAPAPVPTETSSIDISVEKKGADAIILTQLHGQGYSQGTCELIVSRDGKTNKQRTDIIYQPEFSTCAGFSVPVSSIGAGYWQISLSVTPLNGKPIIKNITKEIR